LRKMRPKLPVIMVSSQTERASATTLEALARGASDYVTKPSGAKTREEAIEQVRSQLVPKIRVLVHTETPPFVLPVRRAFTEAPHRSLPPIEVLAVASSTGGPNALAEVFGQIPATLSVPVVIVQHMPPMFTRLLAERLTANGRLPFSEAREGDVLTPGRGWIAPGDHHLKVVRAGNEIVLALDRELPENSCRPSADVLFRSIAPVFRDRVLAVVLTGMGQDGLRGCEDIHRAGGQIIVQDEATSVVWSMPGFVAKAGLADSILPLPDIAGEILRRIPAGRPAAVTLPLAKQSSA